MKQLLKKFKNFRLTAIIEAILGVVVVIAALVLLILYQTNQTRYNPATDEMNNIPGFPGNPLAGMVFFLAGLLAIIFAVVAVYTSLPFIFKKDEKLEPNKLIPYFGAASGVFALVEVIFAFVMTTLEGSRHTVPIIIFAVVLILGLVCQLAMLYPAITVRIVKDDE